MTGLASASVSIARTQRGRFFWAAWWTGAPSRVPFRKPDASNGGAESWAAARAEAERVAGRALVDVDPGWARAFMRTLRGQPPFTEAQARRIEGEAPPPKRARAEEPASIWATLGVAPTASVAEVKLAFRRRALETHPDRGGDADAFRAVREAYDEALARAARRDRRPRPRR
jgi:hypothetical protein